jgi:polyribonucleotide nucleotidyltransferase
MEGTSKIKFGKEDLIFQTGKVAKQANGAVMVQYGGSVVLVTVCLSRSCREGIDFFPLTVEYQEKAYSAGRIPGGFFKREGRPSESEILAARLIDRPIRPLFPEGMRNDVQIVAIVVSSDGQNDPDVMAVNGASAALMLSDIPFNGPIGCCRVARCNKEFILNPTYKEIEESDLEIIVAANRQGVVMLESRCKEVSEEDYFAALSFANEKIQEIIAFQEQYRKQCGKEKIAVVIKEVPAQLKSRVQSLTGKRLQEVYNLGKKEAREEAVDLIAKELDEKLTQEGFVSEDIKAALKEVEKEEVRSKILHASTRVDGRAHTEIRQITCEVSVLPRTHGSSLFTRGQTQSLAVTTLGTGQDEQLVEALEGERYKNFMLHYSFPPFSVGETKPVRGPGRREIGHGALAEKALLAVMPSKEKFPYTVRVVSEILESNGSSSMATVCAATLALMDAGVPIKAPVGGIAMGLVKEKGEHVILTDIAGIEDHFGDMDFKVAGTTDGMTAVQLDVKIESGLDLPLVKKILTQAKDGRMFILGKMKEALAAPRSELSSYAPRITVLKINPDKIGELIGPGGKNIKAIIASTGVTIDIQDDGTVLVGSTEASKYEEALRQIKLVGEDVEVGRIYTARVKRIMPFGAFCEIAPKKEGLVHVSELAEKFVKNVEEVVKLGDEIKVKVIGIDDLGRINLSKKQAEAEQKQ